ncbi:NAD(P)-binding protein [Aspergillus insuetus]
MTKKIISVIGATGTQGGSVVDALLHDDNNYAIRAITRNPKSAAAQKLQAKGVEVVQADAGDVTSLIHAFEGSSAIFAVSDFIEPFATGGPEHAIEVESRHGINFAKAASTTKTLEHYIWSTLPNSKVISGGQIIVPHFESKNRVDDFIRLDAALLAKTTFFLPGFFTENYKFPLMDPINVPGTEQYLQIHCTSPDDAFVSVGHARTNIGLFVRAILAQPEKTLPAKRVAAYTEVTSLGKMLDIWSKVKGKKGHYVRVEKEMYDQLSPMWGEEMSLMMGYFALMGDKAWDGDEKTLTKEDLALTGLVDIAAAFRL